MQVVYKMTVPQHEPQPKKDEMDVEVDGPRAEEEQEQEVEVQVKTMPTPPDGGWGWMVVFASFMIHVLGKSANEQLACKIQVPDSLSTNITSCLFI